MNKEDKITAEQIKDACHLVWKETANECFDNKETRWLEFWDKHKDKITNIVSSQLPAQEQSKQETEIVENDDFVFEISKKREEYNMGEYGFNRWSKEIARANEGNRLSIEEHWRKIYSYFPKHISCQEIIGLPIMRSLLSLPQEQKEKQEPENYVNSYDELKKMLSDTYRKKGDNKALTIKGKRSFTGNELADEIEQETEQGKSVIFTLIRLTIDLLSRDKLNYESSEVELKKLCRRVWMESKLSKDMFDEYYKKEHKELRSILSPPIQEAEHKQGVTEEEIRKAVQDYGSVIAWQDDEQVDKEGIDKAENELVDFILSLPLKEEQKSVTDEETLELANRREKAFKEIDREYYEEGNKHYRDNERFSLAVSIINKVFITDLRSLLGEQRKEAKDE